MNGPSSKIRVHLRGQEKASPGALDLPRLLDPAASRSAGDGPDPFLPPGYLVPVKVFDVGAASRSADDGAPQEAAHDAEADELIVLELEDGGTLITSAGRLHDSLFASHPEWWPGGVDDGSIPFEKLRAEGAAPHRGFAAAVGGLITRVFSIAVGSHGADDLLEKAKEKAKETLPGKAFDLATWGGTKALMWAVESRLFKQHEKIAQDRPAETGWLFRWSGTTGKAEQDFEQPTAAELAAAVDHDKPMLVFVHGTGSSSLGSFGEIAAGDPNLWGALQDHFTGGVFAFEHRTLSASPIENALDLARALPARARVSLVSHSRGGLVADLMCLRGFEPQIDGYGAPGKLNAQSGYAAMVQTLETDAYGPQRETLKALATELHAKGLRIERYVRAASPANGTKLASGNFDVFLSGLLTLIGQVPFFFGSPFYAAFKRVVVDIAKNRTDPHLVPGIEAMLPDSPMARLLRDAPIAEGIRLGLIAGDIEGGNLLKRLGVLLTDFLIFDRDDNDLVVNTTAMLAGIAPRAAARVMFDRGADVSHFRYFTNVGTRTAVRDWLVCADPAKLDPFQPLPQPQDYAAALARASRDVGEARDLPVVVVLPGVMGSYLRVAGKDRVWFDPLDIAAGGLSKIGWDRQGVEADDLFGMFYGNLCERLAKSHRVERFPYDWRQPLDVLGERLGEFLARLLKETDKPVRLLAHSMGGLVVRACIYQRRPVIDALMAREGARLVMLGTPNQGAHSMVANLIGKGDTLRTLVRLDLKHDMQDVLDLIAGFRGALQLLPRPGFKDQFADQDNVRVNGESYQDAKTWSDVIRPLVKDFWFGDQVVARLEQRQLDEGSWLWKQDGDATPRLPEAYEKKSVYVFGTARNTPCAIRRDGDRLRMVGTPHGDGTVTWESGRIGGIGHFYYMNAEHGDLPAAKEHFDALEDLLAAGTTGRLSTAPPASRAIEQPMPVVYDAGPPTTEDAESLGRVLLGGSLRARTASRGRRRLDVQIHAKDLRFLNDPVLVGHYEQDPIAGPQRIIDRELLDGELSHRHSMGLYAGPRGTATVVIRTPNDAERARRTLRGAVVTGLGPYDGALSMANLTESVRAGVLRYLLHASDVLGKADRQITLATLLLGYNSSANLSVAASIEALVRGVMEANARFFETTRLKIYVSRLDIVEIYLDTAITAVYSLRDIGKRLAALAARQDTELVCAPVLYRGEGCRPRLFDMGAGSTYWPRLVITNADTDRPDRPDRPAPPPGAPKPSAQIATRLRFLFVGQRARAESVQLQRQPGLVEGLVAQQIGEKIYREDFGRMLFQLMVPHDFKDAARQLEQMVLVVDETTANLPWELMFADDPSREESERRPLAVRMAMVRQLWSSTFRRQVGQNVGRTALVIGNPSVVGFKAAFSTPEKPLAREPDDLPGAREEATAVARLLGSMGYDVPKMDNHERAADVLAALYRRPWRILHISAHGVFGYPHPDGQPRSGVVLSDGLLITAAEIEAMERVPELVFLNCCHLGQVSLDSLGNKLAASIASELIRIGVRCVIVAGWAVDDAGAQRFGETFYGELLRGHKTFGEAVFTARKAVYDADARDITWGAFQAYGDPAWRAEARGSGASAYKPEPFATPEELLDELSRLRAQQTRRGEISEREMRALVESLDGMLKSRCQTGWLSLPVVQSQLGTTWFALGQFDKARIALQAAVQSEDKDGTVPIHDIERLANVEARLGEQMAIGAFQAYLDATQHARSGRAAAAQVRCDAENAAQALVAGAIHRLETLDAIVAPPGGAGEAAGAGAQGTSARVRNPERSALLAGAHKRLARVFALRTLAAGRDGPGHEEEATQAAAQMLAELERAVTAYLRDEGEPSDSEFSPYLALNRLALDALTPWPDDNRRRAALELARQIGPICNARFQTSGSAFDAIMQSEAALIVSLLDTTLGAPGDAGRLALERLVESYRQSMANLTLKPNQIDSVFNQMTLLSCFLDALWLMGRNDPWQRPWAEIHHRCATRLLELRQLLRPSAKPRTDRPEGPKDDDAAAPRAAGAKKVAAKAAKGAKAVKAVKGKAAAAPKKRR